MINKAFFQLLLLMCPILLQAQTSWQDKIDADVWAEASEQSTFEYFVLLKDHFDTKGAKQYATKDAKATYVFNHLKAKAAETQGELLQLMKQHQADYRPYFIVNGIWVKGDANLLELLAKRDDVQLIAPNPKIQNDLPRIERDYSLAQARSPQGFEWGIGMIRATQLWDFNIKGAGVVLGGQDTGYDWEHPALKNQYRGDSLDHNYYWHDAIHGQISSDSTNSCGYDVNFPCDDQSHGTHTMGTMIGDDGQGNQIGVAPEAQWIGCRNMENGWGTPATYIECFEWFLAPTDTNDLNPDPTMMPHVIANSWGCPAAEGCNPSNFNIMQMAVENLKNGGCFIVVSAGNSGWGGCNTVQDPAAIYEASFSVGATDILDTLAHFSSRGSVTSDGSARMKPNVSAPGVNIRSSVPGGGYSSSSGTSMAGPHVAGAVALLIAAAPALAGHVDSLETLLEMTCDSVYSYRNDTCGGTTEQVFPNNIVGYGRINLYKALEIIRPDLTININKLLTNEIAVFPNPFNDVIQIRTTHRMENCSVVICSALGQEVKRFKTYFDQNLELDLGDLASGLYVITIENNREKVIGKLVKQ